MGQEQLFRWYNPVFSDTKRLSRQSNGYPDRSLVPNMNSLGAGNLSDNRLLSGYRKRKRITGWQQDREQVSGWYNPRNFRYQTGWKRWPNKGNRSTDSPRSRIKSHYLGMGDPAKRQDKQNQPGKMGMKQAAGRYNPRNFRYPDR